MNRIGTRLMVVVGLALALNGVAVVSAHAEENRPHPRRTQVSKRIRRQERRINKDEKSGKISPQQASQLRSQDRSIKQQERADVKANGGHLTQAQQGQLNQELNQNSQQIHQGAHN